MSRLVTKVAATVTQPVVGPLEAALYALSANLANAAVVFGVLKTSQESVVESVVIGAISVAFLIANSVHAKAAKS